MMPGPASRATFSVVIDSASLPGVKKKARRTAWKTKPPGDCEIPRPPSARALAKSILNYSEREARAVRRYFLSQSPGDKVKHLEKVASEPVFGRVHDVWDVWAKDRWWVITSPTNLYRQRDYVSMDYTLSFHVGLMARVMARHEPSVDPKEEQRLSTPWRRWRQAGNALDRAREAEDFQAVGMRCRECLLEFAKAAARNEFVPADRERPAAADFVGWTDLIANAMAPGDQGDAVRGYLKSTAKAAWQLVNWLTHAQNVHRPDGLLAHDATEAVLVAFSMGTLRLQRGLPERCPECRSYRLASDYQPERDAHVAVCESCGWSEEAEEEEPSHLQS